MRTWTLTPEPADGLWPFLLPGVGGAVSWLRELGIQRGMRVGLAGDNSPNTAVLLQALPLVGATSVLFNRRLTDNELRAQRQHANIAWLLAAPTHPLAAEAVVMPDAFAKTAVRDSTPLSDEDPALVLFTSGTTGTAKAARLSWRALRAAAIAARTVLNLTPQTTWIGCLPLDHIGGASIVVRAGFSGNRIVLCERFEPEGVNAALDDGADGISVVPTMLQRLIAKRDGRAWPARLRCLLTGGGPLSPELIATATALGRAPSQTYGLTEAASQVTTLLPDDAPAHPGSAGRALPGLALRIDNGHIHIKGDALFSGYEQRGTLVEPIARGEWFDTGDIGELDDEGFLTVHARRSDVIISGGENVYPAEVEAALMAHPSIVDAGVCPLPDSEWGQIVVAVLVPRDRPITSETIHTWLTDRVAAYKRPKRYLWTNELPRTATGKLLRHQLPHLFH